MTNTDQIDDHIAARRKAIEDDIIIAGGGNCQWAIISLSGAWRFHDPLPTVVRAGLDSREAAEIAREVTVVEMLDSQDARPYGPSEVPNSLFNRVGGVLQLLRSEGVEHDDLVGLAWQTLAVAEGRHSISADLDSEIPF